MAQTKRDIHKNKFYSLLKNKNFYLNNKFYFIYTNAAFKFFYRKGK